MDAVIYKSLGGFYTLKTQDGQLLECKPRGIFRNRGEKPIVGDHAVMQQEAGTWFIDALKPRKNEFVRPPVANLDQILIVVSTTQPVPSLLVIDKLTAAAADQEIKPVLLVTKTDLASPNSLKEAYKTSGIQVLEVNAESGEGLQALREHLKGNLSVLCGNSGVGKSTLLNALMPSAARETGEISRKLGRGRHTTREVEIFELEGGLLADTPGFSSYDLQRAGKIVSENMQFCFPEIESRITSCRYTGCAHITEAGCAVRAGVQAGEIAPGRYKSYVTLYGQAKESEKY